MFKAIAVTDRMKSELFLETEKEVDELWTKARSQMNNGHVVVFGNVMINPKHLHGIAFEKVNDKEVADDFEV